MKITKRKLKNIINLHKDGVSTEVCLTIIIELLGEESSNLVKGTYIHKFYEEINGEQDDKI